MLLWVKVRVPGLWAVGAAGPSSASLYRPAKSLAETGGVGIATVGQKRLLCRGRDDAIARPLHSGSVGKDDRRMKKFAARGRIFAKPVQRSSAACPGLAKQRPGSGRGHSARAAEPGAVQLVRGMKLLAAPLFGVFVGSACSPFIVSGRRCGAVSSRNGPGLLAPRTPIPSSAMVQRPRLCWSRL